MQSFGPKTIQLQGTNLEAVNTKNVATKLITVNDAPRAGQAWGIDSCYFNFPVAKKSNEDILTGLPLEQIFFINMSVGGLEVATQEFIERGKTNEPEIRESRIPATGSLEPITPTSVYPGQSLEIEYGISKSLQPGGGMETGTGLIVITYHLYVP